MLVWDPFFAPLRQARKRRHCLLVIFRLIWVIKLFGAPLSHADSLCVLPFAFQDEALSVQGLGVVRTFDHRPIVVSVSLVKVANFAVTRRHVIAKLRLEQFKILQPHLVFLENFFLPDVSFHRQALVHGLPVFVAENEALLVCLDRGHVVLPPEQVSALLFQSFALALESSQKLAIGARIVVYLYHFLKL